MSQRMYIGIAYSSLQGLWQLLRAQAAGSAGSTVGSTVIHHEGCNHRETCLSNRSGHGCVILQMRDSLMEPSCANGEDKGQGVSTKAFHGFRKGFVQ